MMLKITVFLFILDAVRCTETEHVCDASCKESFFPCTGCLLPVNPYGFFGRNVTLNCTLLDDANSSSSNLYYAWKDDELLPAEYQTVISPSILQLNMPVIDNNEFEGTLMIYCYNNRSKLDMTGVQFLTVDYPPHVSNLSAVCFNWESLKFTWGEYYKHEDHVIVSTIWTAQGANGWYRCNDNGRISCLIVNITSSEYTINVTATNTKVGETFSTTLTVKPDDWVKPAPVTSLRVPSWTSRCVTLTWTHDQLLLKQMIFRAVTKEDGTVHNESSVNSTILCGLKPDTKYTFLVSAKPANGGFWSDTVSINQTTKEDVPSFGANLTGGNFLTGACDSNNERRVDIYLKPPDKQHHNGRLTSFTASAVPSDGSSTIYKDNIPISFTTVELKGLKCNINYSVGVSVSTEIGLSKPTKLNIPGEGVVEPPTIVRVPYNSSSTWVEWKSDVHPRLWTVVWCKGDKAICEDDLDWLNVDGSHRSVAVNFTRNHAGIIFAVSMTTDEGVSSALTWSSCSYDVDKIPKNKPAIQSVNPEPALGLTVMWLPDLCPEYTLITNYIIEHCHSDNTSCKNSTVPSDHKKLVIENLNGGINYSVRLKAVARAGAGPASDPVYVVPLDPTGLSTGEVIGIGFACVFIIVVFLSCMVFCYRYSCKKWKEKEEITLPVVLDLPADSAVTTIAFKPLPKTECVEKPKPTKVLTDRQLSGDSGRGSLTGDDKSPVPLSPSSQSPPKFEAVDEKEEQVKQGLGSELRSGSSLPRDYTKVADKGGSEHPTINCLHECLTDNPWTISDDSLDEESFQNKGFVDYVIAANNDGDVVEENGVNPGFDEDGDKSESDASCQEEKYGEEDCHHVPFTETASHVDEVQVTDGLRAEVSGTDSFREGCKFPNVEHQYKPLAGRNGAGEDVSNLNTQPENPHTSLQGEHSNMDDSHQSTLPRVSYMSCQESRNPPIPSDKMDQKVAIPESRDVMTSNGELDEGLGSCSSSYSSDNSRGQLS